MEQNNNSPTAQQIAQREKQVMFVRGTHTLFFFVVVCVCTAFGKATEGYQNYTHLVPRLERSPEHPVTPRVDEPCSKRAWDKRVRRWRSSL